MFHDDLAKVRDELEREFQDNLPTFIKNSNYQPPRGPQEPIPPQSPQKPSPPSYNQSEPKKKQPNQNNNEDILDSITITFKKTKFYQLN
ncbi:MAG: hypothetical protein GBAus27B_000539 [Mycoplasmataceae bacterium]|nr:MAG: hypothetical protein GBAus27B_000539 [Mycoplasmataceae bacterium]